MFNRAQFADSYQPDFGFDYIPPLPLHRTPELPLNQPSLEEMTVEQLLAYEAWRKEIDARAVANPVGAGWTLPSWRRVMKNWKKYNIIVILGGIRSTKTTLASRLATWAAGTIPGAEVRAYHVNDERSVEQQNAVYEALPIGMRNLPTKKGTFHSLQYSQKNGFTDNVMILPPHSGSRRGGAIKFGNYSQYQQNAQVTEGFKSHLIWCLAEGELVQMADGALKPIESVLVGDEVLSLDGHGKPVSRSVTAVQCSGEKPCVNLRPRNGTSVTCTYDHDIFWGYNFASKTEAKATTRIAQIRPGWWPTVTESRDDAWYIWAALTVAEGSVAQRKVTSGAVEQLEKAISMLPAGATVRRHIFHPRHKHVPDWYLNWPAFWAEFPLQVSETKEIPSWVFRSSQEKARLFLRWLYQGDGWASGHRIGYATTSSRLANQLVILLNRLGIRASYAVRRSKREKWRDQYWVNIIKAEDVFYFIRTIGIEGKYDAVSKVEQEALRRLDSLKTRGQHLHDGDGVNDPYFENRNRQTRLKSSRVVSVTDVGVRRVFDITVANEHRFLAGTSLVSNCDEEVPAKMFETLIYRTTDYHGRIILTFTTLTGWTSLIQDILGKTRTIEKAWAPLLNREVPVMQESLSRPGAVIYYFHTADNVFIDTADFIDKVKHRPREEILARAYGIPSKAIASVFPAFNKEVNVVKHEDLPFIKDPDYPVTRYMALDPAGQKNWFMLWVAIDAAGTWWIYREWPDFDDWALPGNTAEGKPGPAQKGSRKGIKDYIELIKDMEGMENIYERIIDPRLAAAQRQAEEGATTLMGDLDKQGMIFLPAPGGSSSAGKGEIEDGLQLINDLLAWNEGKKRDSLNTPHLFISERCTNMIFAMQEYTAKGGSDENTKDPIDCLRYLRKASCMFLEDMKPDKSRSGGY